MIRRVPFLFAAMPLFAAGPCTEGAEALGRRDLPAAERALRTCTAQPGAPLDAFLMLCGVYQMQGNAAGLYEAAVAGIKHYPADKRFYLTAGAHAGRSQMFADAVNILEPAVRRWPEDGKLASLLESAHLGEGMTRLDAGDNDAALTHLERAVALVPNDVEALLNLGRALHNLNRGEEALEVFDRTLATDPQAPLAQFHRGMAFQALGRFEEAITAIGAELAVNPEHAPARLIRGLALMGRGDAQAALPDLRASVEAMPADATAPFALARCLMRLDKSPEAEPHLLKAIELSPRDPAPRNALVRVLIATGRRDEAAKLAAEAAVLAREERSAAPGEIKFQSYRRPAK
ncbi:MAG: tetratricopeptide repeat protein [Bryobacteraceae bacterium]